MMVYVVIAFLWVSILLYLLLGGADFGAGIIELFTRKSDVYQTRRTLYKAIGPIWEANHMWLIIAIVILFVGFPAIYALMSTYLHIPLTLMLLGIVARGTAFAFRHYDAVVDDMQGVYNKIFAYSSFITPLFLGIIAGSTVAGSIDPNANDFLAAYIYSWLSWFTVSVGLFTVAICAFLAAVYLIGESENPVEKTRFMKKARVANIAAVIAGSLVFISAHIQGIPLINWIFGNYIGITAIAAATLSLVFLWYFMRTDRTNILRILAGFQVTMILLAVTIQHFPNIVILKAGYLSLLEHSGHDQTIYSLAVALLLGSIFILPALFYLVYSFQKKQPSGRFPERQ